MLSSYKKLSIVTKIFLFALKWITNEKETGAELTFEKTSGNVTEDREKINNS